MKIDLPPLNWLVCYFTREKIRVNRFGQISNDQMDFFLLILNFFLPLYKDSAFLFLHICILKENSQISLLIIIRNLLEITISNVYYHLQRRFQSFIFCGLYYLLLQCYKILFVCFVKFQINFTLNMSFKLLSFPHLSS